MGYIFMKQTKTVAGKQDNVLTQGKYASSSKRLNGWMLVWQNWKKKLQ
jgi:hypothetical protein